MAADRMKIVRVLLVLIIQLFSFSLAKSKLVVLDEDNWHQMLEGEWMVEFYAPWCPACKALQPIWEDFAEWGDDLSISVGQVDVTNTPGLSGRFMVTALPTIYHVKDGVFRQYRGSREREEFLSFIEEKRWEKVEEVPAWKSPASLQMSVVSQFFKLSMVLRSVHSVLVEEYGLPTWGSYLVFALATILVGALLGLILVCIIDFMFPPKAPGQVPLPTTDEDGDIIEDTVKSDPGKEDEGEEEKKEEEEVAKQLSGDEQSQDEEEEEQNEGEAEEEEEEGEVEVEAEAGEKEEEGEPKKTQEVRKRRPRKAD